ncbi:MAG: hypothetical protein IJC25_04745 [Clostridia bacterium]|nr:hypothetical protein [Clostridia bacterium]
MKRTIRQKVYDTATATELGYRYVAAYGDPTGFEEHLFRTPEGNCFLYGFGGTESPYKTAKIRPVSQEAAQEWLDTCAAKA